jgi:hypothetical protein
VDNTFPLHKGRLGRCRDVDGQRISIDEPVKPLTNTPPQLLALGATILHLPNARHRQHIQAMYTAGASLRLAGCGRLKVKARIVSLPRCYSARDSELGVGPACRDAGRADLACRRAVGLGGGAALLQCLVICEFTYR